MKIKISKIHNKHQIKGINKLKKKYNIKTDIIQDSLQIFFDNHVNNLNSKGHVILNNDKLMYRRLLEKLTNEFSIFLKILSKKSNIIFVKRPFFKKSKSYVSDWEINNLNGNFAYNNITEDF